MAKLTHMGKLLHECGIPGETRANDRYPGHINGTQLSENRFLLLYSTRGWRGSDDNMSVIYQIRDSAYDGPLVREGRLAHSIDDWDPFGDGHRYVKSHLHPLGFGVPGGTIVNGTVPPQAGLFVFIWHRYARWVDPATGLMPAGTGFYDRTSPFDASTVTEWTQLRLNEAEDDLMVVQPVQPLRQKGYEVGYSFCEQEARLLFPTFTIPVPFDAAGSEWVAPQSFYRDAHKFSAALRFTFDPLRHRYQWTETSPLSAEGLFEPSALPYEDGWIISARMTSSWENREVGGPIAWMRMDDPFAPWPEPLTPSPPMAGKPSTAYRCADGVVRALTNSLTLSPYHQGRNPLYLWDIDPAQGFAATGHQVVFDSVAADLPISEEAGPVVDQGKIFPHAGGRTQVIAHRLRTGATFDASYGGRRNPISPAEQEVSGIYYAELDLGSEYPAAWSFA